MRKLREFDWLKTDNFAELSAKLFHYYFSQAVLNSIRHFSSITDKILIEQNPCLLLTRFYRSKPGSALIKRVYLTYHNLWRFQQLQYSYFWKHDVQCTRITRIVVFWGVDRGLGSERRFPRPGTHAQPKHHGGDERPTVNAGPSGLHSSRHDE
jgi:hypothetical protein